MPTKRDENYVTDKILVPYYNKSARFRAFISEKFGQGFSFGDRLRTTCDKRNEKYGNPDAESSDGKNFVEVKISNGAKLQPNEMAGGSYEQRLRDFPDNHLLYIVNDAFPMSNAVKHKRAKTIYWSEIYDFIEESDNTDPVLQVLAECVQGLESKGLNSSSISQKDFLLFINNLNLELIRKHITQFEIAKQDFFEDDFWIELKNNEFFSGFDFETGSADEISVSVNSKYVDDKIMKKLEKIDCGLQGVDNNGKITHIGLCHTSDFLAQSEKSRIDFFVKKLNEILNVIKG